MLFPVDPVLQVGDRVRIVCSERAGLCVDRVVGSDGTVLVPLVGALPAATRHLDEVARRIFECLPSPDGGVHIEVRLLGGGRNEVRIGGAVARSLVVFAPRGVSLDRLLAVARPTPDADMTLLPKGGRIAPGSTVDVPSATAERRIAILGAVASPCALAPATNLVLSSALAAAGGTTPHADPERVVVVRYGESIPLILPADAGFLLQPGDVVRVGLRPDRHYVTVGGLVAHPGSVEYAPGMTATQAFAAAGGLLSNAQKGTLLWQTGPKTFRLSLAFLLARRIPDPVLGPGDTLTVERS